MNQHPERPIGLSDEDLLKLLGEMLDMTEPIPIEAVEAAYAAVDMDLLSEELAALVFDSMSASGELVSMRSVDVETRLLSFVNDHLTVDLELHADGRTIVGQLTPATTVVLQVETEEGLVIEVDVDDFGRFRVVAPAGPIRIRATGLLITPWITR